ncbi:MAG TPA: hypothetical protein PK801_07655 [Aggregatilineales bacterium]|nr:hypothetical protein [Chloroflexota bacterium]HOA22488.1 hypothetical protein [Aggregatilineales bacterium]HPV08002.1 hypothetical protein [Aggregatilineales bacterium]HQA68183.1 hypothetical protein [Aggregatilineales bacterium]HQE18617.1 hypothetical protein [Aggregatilineales bacterium]
MVDTSKVRNKVSQTLDSALQPVQEMGWQPKVYALGGLIGLALGLLTAYFYVRSVEEQQGAFARPQAPTAGDTVKLGLSLMGVIRSITEWAAR